MEPPPLPQDAALPAPLLHLPRALVHAIFAALPVDTRLRCSEVCRGWRAALLDPSLWTHVDLHGVLSTVEPRSYERLGALLRTVSARARGGMRSLDTGDVPLEPETLLAVITANAASLRALRSCHAQEYRGAEAEENRADWFFPRGVHEQLVERLLRAAPRLDVFEADVGFDDNPQRVTALLRRAAPLHAPLRVRRLEVNMRGADWPAADVDGEVRSLADDITAHGDSLRELRLVGALLDGAGRLDALVDALRTHAGRVRALTLHNCVLPPPEAGGGAAAFARLITLPGLQALKLDDNAAPPADAPGMEALAAALASSTTLTSVSLDWTDVWTAGRADTLALLTRALSGHVSLRTLCLGRYHGGFPNSTDAAAARVVGAALGALIAANAPALTELDVSDVSFGDAGLSALFEALPHNSHLRSLLCWGMLPVSGACARGVLLPAVRANESLRELSVSCDGMEALEQAVALVDARSA
jgi:hypothetical protein